LKYSNGYSGPVLCRIGPKRSNSDNIEKSNHANAIVPNRQQERQSKNRRISEQGWQLLLPFLEPVFNTERAVDELIDVTDEAAIEVVLLLSTRRIRGPKQADKAKCQIAWHGRQHGIVSLSQRKLRVEKPR
jgi:hypothetical protein